MDKAIRFHDLKKLTGTERGGFFKRTASELGRYVDVAKLIIKAVKEIEKKINN